MKRKKTLGRIRFNEPETFFSQLAHDDEQQQLLQQQHR